MVAKPILPEGYSLPETVNGWVHDPDREIWRVLKGEGSSSDVFRGFFQLLALVVFMTIHSGGVSKVGSISEFQEKLDVSDEELIRAVGKEDEVLEMHNYAEEHDADELSEVVEAPEAVLEFWVHDVCEMPVSHVIIDVLEARAKHYVHLFDYPVHTIVEQFPGSDLPGAAWGTFQQILEYKCEREGTHFVEVDPRNTTKECASCGVKTDKPLWVREHSCPACGFEADRDANAAWNILSRGLEDIGVVHSESTPVETALPTDTVVSAKRVIETGSPTLKERTASAVSE